MSGSESRGIVVVTGATGLLGARLCPALAARGWEVRAAARDPSRAGGIAGSTRAGRLDLPDEIDTSLFENARGVIHAAWATRMPDVERARRINEDGTARVLETARRAGVSRFVFVSSVAAAPDAPQFYARSKAAAERLLDPERDLIIRPGVILSREGEGIFRQMKAAITGLHVVPMFGGGRQPVQTIHVDDACEGIARALESDITGALNLAEPEPVSLAEFVRLIADRLKVRCVLVPMPFGPVLLALRLIEALHLPAPLSSESLMGVRALRALDTREDLRRLGLKVRPVRESLDDLLGRKRKE